MSVPDQRLTLTPWFFSFLGGLLIFAAIGAGGFLISGILALSLVVAIGEAITRRNRSR